MQKVEKARVKIEQVFNVDKTRKKTEEVVQKKDSDNVKDKQSDELIVEPEVMNSLDEVDSRASKAASVVDKTVDHWESEVKPDTKIVELESDEKEMQAVDTNVIELNEVKEPEKTAEQISQELRRQAVENMTRITSSNPFTLGPKISDWDAQRALWLERNPHMKSTDPHKPKILLVTGSQPWPCRSAVGDHYLLKMLKNKVDYARQQNLKIFYNFAHLEKPMSSFWAKLPLIRKMMLTRPEMEWIFWMDSDAMFTDMVFEIPFEKYSDYNLVMFGSDSGIYKDRSWMACNTGVFFIRNNQWTLDLLDEWVLLGSEGEIRHEAGKILTAYLTFRPEMMADDQSALVFLMLTRRELRPKIHLEAQYALSGYWEYFVPRYEEYTNNSRPGDMTWPFTTHFTGCQPCSGEHNLMFTGNSCLDGMERAFNFADNQVLRALGYAHESLSSSAVNRIINETSHPLSSVPIGNRWAVESFY